MFLRVLAAVLVLASGSVALAQQAKPVMIGGDADFDACGAVGQIVGLDPNGDNYLSVRAGPNSRATEVDRLHEFDNVFICDDEGRWIGVVYGRGTCGVTSPVSARRAYSGGCKSGWVFRDYVELIAG